MLNVAVGMQGEDGVDRVLDVLARPVRGERACWRVLAWFWTRAFRPMASVGVAGACTVGFLVLQRCSRTRGWVEREARERGAKGGRVCLTW